MGLSYGKYVALMYERGGCMPAPAAEAEATEEKVEERRCVICGAMLRPGTRRATKTCGPACSYELNRRGNRERYQKNTKFQATEDRACAWCGGGFLPNRRFQQFCGRKCQEAHKRAVKRGETAPAELTPGMANRSYGTGECVICGEQFIKRSARQVTCSAGCRKVYSREKAKEK